MSKFDEFDLDLQVVKSGGTGISNYNATVEGIAPNSWSTTNITNSLRCSQCCGGISYTACSLQC